MNSPNTAIYTVTTTGLLISHVDTYIAEANPYIANAAGA